MTGTCFCNYGDSDELFKATGTDHLSLCIIGSKIHFIWSSQKWINNAISKTYMTFHNTVFFVHTHKSV